MRQKIDSLMIGQICRIEYIICRQDTTLRIKKAPFSKKIWLSFFSPKDPFFAFLDYSHQARHLDGLELSRSKGRTCGNDLAGRRQPQAPKNRFLDDWSDM